MKPKIHILRFSSGCSLLNLRFSSSRDRQNSRKILRFSWQNGLPIKSSEFPNKIEISKIGHSINKPSMFKPSCDETEILWEVELAAQRNMWGYPAQSLLPSTPSEPAVLVILFTKHSEYEFAPCTSCTSPTAADTGRADTSRADANRRSLKRGAQHRVTVSSSVSRRSVRPGHLAAWCTAIYDTPPAAYLAAYISSRPHAGWWAPQNYERHHHERNLELHHND